MLPDLPSFKADVVSELMRYFRNQTHSYLGIFSELGKHTAFEGNRFRIIRADGTIEDSEYKQASATFNIKYDEIPTLTIQDRVSYLDKMAKELADQIASHMFDSLNKTLEEAGQVVDGAGESLNGEMLLKVLDSIQIDFDNDGQHSPLKLVCSPEKNEAARAAFAMLENDEGLRLRHEGVLKKKWMDWRDRETSRKLVG